MEAALRDARTPAAAGGQRIRTPDQRLRVFVSSTLEELAEERQAIRAAIEQLRLAPVMFESGARPHAPRALYRAYLDQAEIFVGVYWQRYGWVGPRMEISGIEDEFRLSAAMPRLLYVKQPATDREPGLQRMLETIEADGTASYTTFRDAGELRQRVLDDLAILLAERFDVAERRPVELALRPVPTPVTTLIGRETAVDEVATLLRHGRRLIVLTGAGGIGKTRLALAVAERLRRHWSGGVAFVDLSAVTEASRVPAAIGDALGIVAQGHEPMLDALARRLADRHLLLMLDNLEQVVDAAPMVAHLLERVPFLQVLATSRVVLHLRGEQEWPVPPLPSGAVDATLSAAAEAPAVRMLVERVRLVDPHFTLTEDNVPAVVELCRRLDGLPLALELAAARLRVLTPQQMLERLDERMAKPVGLVNVPDRQRTLAATLEWSYDLLPATAKQVLTRLSVFSGPFTIEGAEAVCGGDGVDALEGLSTLVDHSMVSPADRPDGQPAFRLLETVREFAAARLEDGDTAFSRLEAYLLRLVAEAAATRGARSWALRRLDSETANMQAVFLWTIHNGRSPGPLLRAVEDAWAWLYVHAVLRRMPDLRELIRSSPAAPALTDRDWDAVHRLQVIVLFNDGEYARLARLLDEVLPMMDAPEESTGRALMLMVRAICRRYAPGGPARAEFECALATVNTDDEPLARGYVLVHYGSLLLLDGDTVGARAAHDEALGIARAVGDLNLVAEASYQLTFDLLAVGDIAAARARLISAINYYQDVDHREGLARCLGAACALALQSGDARVAARLTGTAATIRDEIALEPWPLVAEAERRIAERVRGLVPDDERAELVRVGRGSQVGEALDLALATLATPELVQQVG